MVGFAQYRLFTKQLMLERRLRQLLRLRWVISYELFSGFSWWNSREKHNGPGCLVLQTEQMSRVVNELDSINFSIKKASKLVKEIGRQVSFFRNRLPLYLIGFWILLMSISPCTSAGCNWSMYYGPAVHYCCWSHSHHYCEGWINVFLFLSLLIMVNWSVALCYFYFLYFLLKKGYRVTQGSEVTSH